MLDGKNKAYFGRFSSEMDAAIAYDHAAIQFRCIKVRKYFYYIYLILKQQLFVGENKL